MYTQCNSCKSHWHYKSVSLSYRLHITTWHWLINVGLWSGQTCVIFICEWSRQSVHWYPCFLMLFFKSSVIELYIYYINRYISQINFNEKPQDTSHNFPSIRPRQFSVIPPFGSVGRQNKGEKETNDPSWYDQFPSWLKSFPSIWINVNGESVTKR